MKFAPRLYRSGSTSTKAAFFDLDGTIRQHRDGPEHFINHAKDVVLLPDVINKLRELYDENYMLNGITNQGGVAHGHVTETDVRMALHRTAQLLGEEGVEFTDFFYAPEYDENRKPHPGMIFAALQCYNIDLAESIFVGDRKEDCEAALAAGVPFSYDFEFFNRPVKDMK